MIQPHMKEWAAEVLNRILAKMPYSIQDARRQEGIPYTVKDGHWLPNDSEGINWWTNGFWPAQMLLLYDATGDEMYLQEARRTEEMLDEAFRRFEHLHHDVGFMWRISSGYDWELTGHADNYRRTMLAAQLLAARFNPNGFIRAWNGGRDGWAIIDCMMNLSLLYFASEHSGDPRYTLIAKAHADSTMRDFIRPDGSSDHIVAYDANTGKVLDRPRGQGFAPGSKWSRGAAWSIYGFAISYLHTQEKRYLETAIRAADHFIAQVSKDWLPNCDFCQPDDVMLKDDCAGCIAACGMLVLAEALGEKGQQYVEAAYQLLHAIEDVHTDWTTQTPAILTHCTAAYHSGDHHIAMNYGDFFFVEGILRLLDATHLRW